MYISPVGNLSYTTNIATKLYLMRFVGVSRRRVKIRWWCYDEWSWAGCSLAWKALNPIKAPFCTFWTSTNSDEFLCFSILEFLGIPSAYWGDLILSLCRLVVWVDNYPYLMGVFFIQGLLLLKENLKMARISLFQDGSAWHVDYFKQRSIEAWEAQEQWLPLLYYLEG